MSVPPPPPPPQGPWQPGPAGQPPGQGQPGQGQPPGPPPWGPQQGWPPPGSPKKSNGLKWALGAVALIAVIAVAVAVTLAFTRSGSGGGTSDGGGSGSTSGIASADDTGSVAVITDEPTCDQFMPINNGLAAQEQNGWIDRDPSIPATDWTPDQRNQYEAVGTAMRNAADQMVTLAKQTPHRIVRELYEQAIAYWRAYTDNIPTYTPVDDHLARVATSASLAVRSACLAISSGSASAWGPLVPTAAPPSHGAPAGDPANPQRFLPHRDPNCGDWMTLVGKYANDTSAWMEIDPGIPASQWNPDQKAVNDSVIPTMVTFADNAQQLGGRSTNPIFQDLIVFTAQYTRAYVKGLPSYISSDSYLSGTASNAGATLSEACKAVGVR